MGRFRGLHWVAPSRGSSAQFPFRPSSALVAVEAPRSLRALMFVVRGVVLAAPAFAHSGVPGASVLPLSPPVALRLLPPPPLAHTSLAARGCVCCPPRVLLRYARLRSSPPWSFVGLSPLSASGCFRLSPRLSPRRPASRPKSAPFRRSRSASQSYVGFLCLPWVLASLVVSGCLSGFAGQGAQPDVCLKMPVTMAASALRCLSLILRRLTRASYQPDAKKIWQFKKMFVLLHLESAQGANKTH